MVYIIPFISISFLIFLNFHRVFHIHFIVFQRELSAALKIQYMPPIPQAIEVPPFLLD